MDKKEIKKREKDQKTERKGHEVIIRSIIIINSNQINNKHRPQTFYFYLFQYFSAMK